MESTVEGEQLRASGRRLKNDLSDSVNDIKAVASGEIKSLIADVEDLMARIADLKDADVGRVRSKVQRAVGTDGHAVGIVDLRIGEAGHARADEFVMCGRRRTAAGREQKDTQKGETFFHRARAATRP